MTDAPTIETQLGTMDADDSSVFTKSAREQAALGLWTDLLRVTGTMRALLAERLAVDLGMLPDLFWEHAEVDGEAFGEKGAHSARHSQEVGPQPERRLLARGLGEDAGVVGVHCAELGLDCRCVCHDCLLPMFRRK